MHVGDARRTLPSVCVRRSARGGRVHSEATTAGDHEGPVALVNERCGVAVQAETMPNSASSGPLGSGRHGFDTLDLAPHRPCGALSTRGR